MISGEFGSLVFEMLAQVAQIGERDRMVWRLTGVEGAIFTIAGLCRMTA